MDICKERRAFALIFCVLLAMVLACSFAMPNAAHAAKAKSVTLYVDSGTQKTVNLKAKGLKAAKAYFYRFINRRSMCFSGTKASKLILLERCFLSTVCSPFAGLIFLRRTFNQFVKELIGRKPPRCRLCL